MRGFPSTWLLGGALIATTLAGWIGCSETDDAQAGRAACRLVEDGYGPPGELEIRAEQVVTCLEVPWGIAFLPDGSWLVTERPGRVRLVRGGALHPDPVVTIETAEGGEGGLLGIAAHPQFGSNRLFYVYFTASKDGRNVNRLERYRLAEDGVSATPDRIILDDIPAGTFHNGGRIRFGPDGKLYVGTGDAREPGLSQDERSLAGKILRLNDDGTVPGDNPSAGSPVFVRGIRNTQGFDWLNDETLIVTDHGPSGELGRSGHDRVLFARAGDNLGWPESWTCEAGAGHVAPALVFEDALPPGGAAFYPGGEIPEWSGSLIVGSLGSEHLQRVGIERDPLGAPRNEVYLDGELGRIREVITGPGGELYVTTSNCDGRGACGSDRDGVYRLRKGP